MLVLFVKFQKSIYKRGLLKFLEMFSLRPVLDTSFIWSYKIFLSPTICFRNSRYFWTNCLIFEFESCVNLFKYLNDWVYRWSWCQYISINNFIGRTSFWRSIQELLITYFLVTDLFHTDTDSCSHYQLVLRFLQFIFYYFFFYSYYPYLCQYVLWFLLSLSISIWAEIPTVPFYQLEKC